MDYNLNGKVFRSVSNSENGDVDAATIFYYQQQGEIVTARYGGGSIVAGHLIAKVLPNGQLDMRYHHLNQAGEFMLGKCLSTPSRLPDGRLKFAEAWQWLSGDGSSGRSEIEEIGTYNGTNSQRSHVSPAEVGDNPPVRLAAIPTATASG